MAKQNNRTYYNPFVTTGGTYENPRLGITDYGAFDKGFKQGLQPGMDFMKEQEVKEKVDKKEREIDASLIKDIELVGGEYFDTGVWNPNVDIKNSTKNTLVGFRDELLNKNTTEERKKEIRSSYQNLVTANASLAHILDVDSDSELYSKNASNLNELFVDQGTTLDDFRQAYNDGKAIPTVQNGVGGYLVNGKFIDFENKINVNTVNEKMNLRSDNKVNEAATSFAGQNQFKTAPTSTAAFTSLNNDGSKEYNTKVTTILNEYGDSASVSAEQAANQWAVNNQSMLPGIVQDMRSAEFLTKDERTMLNAIEPRHGRFNSNAVKSEARELFESANSEGRSITMEEATDQIMQQHKDFKDSLAQRYLKNEFLKKTAGFKVNPDTGIAELYDPRKDTSQGLTTPKSDDSGFGYVYSGNPQERYVELNRDLNKAVKGIANINAMTQGGIALGAAEQELLDVEVGKITSILNAAVTAEDKKAGGVSFKTKTEALELFNSRLDDDGQFVLSDETTLNDTQTARLLEKINNPKAVIFEFDKNGEMTSHNFENATVKTLGNLVYNNLSDSKQKTFDQVFYDKNINMINLENNASKSLRVLADRAKNTSFEDANVISGFTSMRVQDKFAFLNATEDKQQNSLFNELSTEEQADYMLSLKK